MRAAEAPPVAEHQRRRRLVEMEAAMLAGARVDVEHDERARERREKKKKQKGASMWAMGFGSPNEKWKRHRRR